MSILDLQGLETPEVKAGAKIALTGPSNLSVSVCGAVSQLPGLATKGAKATQSTR